MKQKYIWISLFVAFLAFSFNTKIMGVDNGIDIMAGDQPVNMVSNITLSITIHEPESLQAIYISKESLPLERGLVKSHDIQNNDGISMPIAPMPVVQSSRSTENNKSGLFSFDTPKEENNNQNWGWVDSAVNNADNYSDLPPPKYDRSGLFRDSELQSSFGSERESFFDDTLYGSGNENNFLDGYDFQNSSSKDSDSSPYSTMSW